MIESSSIDSLFSESRRRWECGNGRFVNGLMRAERARENRVSSRRNRTVMREMHFCAVEWTIFVKPGGTAGYSCPCISIWGQFFVFGGKIMILLKERWRACINLAINSILHKGE